MAALPFNSPNFQAVPSSPHPSMGGPQAFTGNYLPDAVAANPALAAMPVLPQFPGNGGGANVNIPQPTLPTMPAASAPLQTPTITPGAPGLSVASGAPTLPVAAPTGPIPRTPTGFPSSPQAGYLAQGLNPGAFTGNSGGGRGGF